MLEMTNFHFVTPPQVDKKQKSTQNIQALLLWPLEGSRAKSSSYKRESALNLF